MRTSGSLRKRARAAHSWCEWRCVETKAEASRVRFADVIREEESSPGLYELQSWLLLMSMVRLPTPPNKAPEPTPMSVTSPAIVRRIEWLTLRHQPPVAGAAPAMGVAHL